MLPYGFYCIKAPGRRRRAAADALGQPRAVEFSTDTDEFEGEVEVESGAVAGVFDVVDA
jgi:hypothetical protein